MSDTVQEGAWLSTVCEKRADDAERKADDVYKAAYMKEFLGESYLGVISGVTSFGIFVELENSCEGLVRLEDLPAGYYRYDESTFTLFSSKNSYSLGQKIKVTVANADVSEGNIDFILAKE